MRRQDLRNRAPKFRGFDPTKPLPKPRRTLPLATVLKRIAFGVLILVAVACLWETQKACEAAKGPNHRLCVD
ncbi:MAG TPA: hypothetical protein VIK75_11050 [Calditerricola sp.]